MEPLTANSTKMQEFDMLTYFMDLVGEGSYLASFLTKELAAELTRRIADDWSMDIYKELQSQQKQTEDARNFAVRQQVEIDRLTKTIADEQNATLDFEAKVIEQKKELEKMLALKKEQIDSLMEVQMNLEAENRRLHERIVELKVEIYEIYDLSPRY